MSGDNRIERRRHGREGFTLVVAYEGADELVRDFTENLSAGGIFVQTSREIPVGTDVQLSLSFPGLLRPISLVGVVRWVRSEETERGLGIEFSDRSAAAIEELGAVVRGIADRDPALVGRLLKVMVVEDNPHVAQLIREGLQGGMRRALRESVAFEFVTAGNGREALDRLSSTRFDALIVDIYLPVLDGASVIAAVRADARHQNTPIIAVSAGGSAARVASYRAGADFFLDKPMRLKDIIATMQRLMVAREGTEK